MPPEYTVEILDLNQPRCPTALVCRTWDYQEAKQQMAYYAAKYGVLAKVDWGPCKSVAWVAGRCRGGLVKP